MFSLVQIGERGGNDKTFSQVNQEYLLTIFPSISMTVEMSLYSGYRWDVISSVTKATSRIFLCEPEDRRFLFAMSLLARKKVKYIDRLLIVFRQGKWPSVKYRTINVTLEFKQCDNASAALLVKQWRKQTRSRQKTSSQIHFRLTEFFFELLIYNKDHATVNTKKVMDYLSTGSQSDYNTECRIGAKHSNIRNKKD